VLCEFVSTFAAISPSSLLLGISYLLTFLVSAKKTASSGGRETRRQRSVVARDHTRRDEVSADKFTDVKTFTCCGQIWRKSVIRYKVDKIVSDIGDKKT